MTLCLIAYWTMVTGLYYQCLSNFTFVSVILEIFIDNLMSSVIICWDSAEWFNIFSTWSLLLWYFALFLHFLPNIPTLSSKINSLRHLPWQNRPCSIFATPITFTSYLTCFQGSLLASLYFLKAFCLFLADFCICPALSLYRRRNKCYFLLLKSWLSTETISEDFFFVAVIVGVLS